MLCLLSFIYFPPRKTNGIPQQNAGVSLSLSLEHWGVLSKTPVWLKISPMSLCPEFTADIPEYFVLYNFKDLWIFTDGKQTSHTLLPQETIVGGLKGPITHPKGSR